MYKKFVIGKKERIITFKNAKPKSVYSEGVFRVPAWAFDEAIELKSETGLVTENKIGGWDLEDLTEEDCQIADQFDVINLKANQVGIIKKSDQLTHILEGGKKHVFWKNKETKELKVVDVEANAFIEDNLFNQLITKKNQTFGDNITNWHLCNLKPNEIALIYKNKALFDVSEQKQFGIWQTLYKHEVVKLDVNELVDAQYAKNQNWLDNEKVNALLTKVKTQDNQIAVITLHNKIKKVLAPNDEVYLFNQKKQFTVELFSIAEDICVKPRLAEKLKRANLLETYCKNIVLDNQINAIVYKSGSVYKMLTSGEHVFWNFENNIKIIAMDLKWQDVEVAGQEILTKDRVSIRINLNAQYKIQDIQKVTNEFDAPEMFMYKSLQLALREVIGTRTLDELLIEKDKVSLLLNSQIKQKIKNTGLELGEVGIKDIILPGEMKEILNQVVQAQKTAEANNIRRREETAQTRSLQNTAKMMDGNETLHRLKELETLEKVVEKVGQLNVYGGLDQLMTGLLPSQNNKAQ